jgi:hypothetical protein
MATADYGAEGRIVRAPSSVLTRQRDWIINRFYRLQHDPHNLSPMDAHAQAIRDWEAAGRPQAYTDQTR